MSPDLRRKVDAARARRLAAESEVRKQTGLQVRRVVHASVHMR